MDNVKEIGGYFSLDFFNTYDLPSGVMLNSARNALRYIVKVYDIKELLVPYYTCPVVWKALEQENVTPIFYHINSDLEIDLPYLPEDKYVLVNNYFGVKGRYIKRLATEYPKLIIDDAQSFYAPKVGLAHFKSPRKFFGLPDGGIALCDKWFSQDIPQGISWHRCSHLLIRSDVDAQSGYNEFKKNDASLDDEPIEKMSNLTLKFLSSVDFEYAKRRRLENFSILHKNLKNKNLLSLDLDVDDVPMVYPFLCKDENLRQKLINEKIFVAQYWPDIDVKCSRDSYELTLQQYLIPLPLDQRYDEFDMQRILEVLNGN